MIPSRPPAPTLEVLLETQRDQRGGPSTDVFLLHSGLPGTLAPGVCPPPPGCCLLPGPAKLPVDVDVLAWGWVWAGQNGVGEGVEMAGGHWEEEAETGQLVRR